MGLRMKNLNICGVYWKIGEWVAGAGGGGLGQFSNLKEGAWQERGGIWLGVDTPMHIM